MKREFLQLAQTFDPVKHQIGGWYASEKLDGMRAFWDGGWSRGKLTSQVPYANIQKDYIRVNPVRATGLWSRYAKPIQAPAWFLDQLPPDVLLDGELYIGPQQFQRLMSAVKKLEPIDAEWAEVRYRVFDAPSAYQVFAPGKINTPNHKAEIPDCRPLFDHYAGKPTQFYQVVHQFQPFAVTRTGILEFHNQFVLPATTEKCLRAVDELMAEVTSKGGEGIIVRRPASVWQPIRTWDMLKIKPEHDAEGIVVGWTEGKGKLLGLMGALTVKSNDGKTFNLSGFTDEERRLLGTGEPAYFALGSVVTYKYRELTDDGKPKEARYFRKPT